MAQNPDVSQSLTDPFILLLPSNMKTVNDPLLAQTSQSGLTLDRALLGSCRQSHLINRMMNLRSI
ncbi:MAG: hypothetical protein ACI9CO_001547 [Candidatus Azotimanducaceae bacterium]